MEIKETKDRLETYTGDMCYMNIDEAIKMLQDKKEKYPDHRLYFDFDYESYSDDRELYLYGLRKETEIEARKREERETEFAERQIKAARETPARLEGKAV